MFVFYLHGFASSAQSTKAAFFAARLRAHGIELRTPDFNTPDFSTLTITRMVERVLADIETLPAGPVVLIGSSLGAFVAVQAAVKTSRVTHLVLLAPALDFGHAHEFRLGDRTLEEWKRTGTTNVFHYGYGRVLPIGYALYSDACAYDCLEAKLTLPIQVFMGRRDAVVRPEAVKQWARERPNVELHLLDDEHQLAESLDPIWREMKRFLALQ